MQCHDGVQHCSCWPDYHCCGCGEAPVEFAGDVEDYAVDKPKREVSKTQDGKESVVTL